MQLHEHLQPLRSGKFGGITALRSRLDRLPVAAFAADDHGRYVAVNGAAADLTGFDVRELETKSVWELTPDVDARTGERLWMRSSRHVNSAEPTSWSPGVGR